MCRVLCVCVRWLCMCVESECGTCAESVWDVRFVFWCCGVLCCVVMCGVGAGVGAQCVVCGVCGVRCVVCVWLGLARGKTPVCRFKMSPCVGSKRIRVYRQNARTCATCARFASTHRSVLNVHTETFLTYTRRGRRGEGGGFSSHCFSLPFYLSLVRRSLSLLSFSSLFPLLSSFSSLSATMTMITRPVGSLCVHTALTCLRIRVPVLWLIPCLANTFVSCKKQLSWCNCASLVPLGMKWACICAGNGCCVWWCL